MKTLSVWSGILTTLLLAFAFVSPAHAALRQKEALIGVTEVTLNIILNDVAKTMINEAALQEFVAQKLEEGGVKVGDYKPGKSQAISFQIQYTPLDQEKSMYVYMLNFSLLEQVTVTHGEKQVTIWSITWMANTSGIIDRNTLNNKVNSYMMSYLNDFTADFRAANPK